MSPTQGRYFHPRKSIACLARCGPADCLRLSRQTSNYRPADTNQKFQRNLMMAKVFSITAQPLLELVTFGVQDTTPLLSQANRTRFLESFPMQFCRRAPTLLIFLMLTIGASIPSPGFAQTSEPLVQKANLVYEGAFRLPQIPCESGSDACFGWGGIALAYDAAHNSLYLVGNPQGELTAEVSIPPLVNSTNLSDLNTATLIQPFTDAANGRRNAVNPTDPNAQLIAGQLVYDGRLILAIESYYDGDGTQTTSHFARSLDLASATPFVGPITVGSQYPGFVSGYMTTIPSEWQSLFGGPALTGNCCLNIIAEQSNGPAISVFDPDKIGVSNPVPAVALVGYPHYAALATPWNTQSDLFNGTTIITGVAFPPGTRSVLFFGRQGTGPFCYGPGTSDPSLAGTIVTGTASEPWCLDPADSDKGTHAYPYAYQVWAYDANDFLAVKNGSKRQYDVRPYAVWSFHLPFENAQGPHKLGGTAYDQKNGLIYVSQECADTACNPIIHAFKVDLSAPPAAPRQIRVR